MGSIGRGAISNLGFVKTEKLGNTKVNYFIGYPGEEYEYQNGEITAVQRANGSAIIVDIEMDAKSPKTLLNRIAKVPGFSWVKDNQDELLNSSTSNLSNDYDSISWEATSDKSYYVAAIIHNPESKYLLKKGKKVNGE